MSVENRILSEEQREFVNRVIGKLCTPGGCRVLSRADCSVGELIDDRLPFCFADKSKRARLEEGVQRIAERDGIELKIVIPILKFLATKPIVTKDELKAWRSRHPPMTLGEILEQSKAQNKNKKSRP